MKYLRLLILMLLPVLIPAVGNADSKDDDNLYFYGLRDKDGAEYGYMSPLMIKAIAPTDKDLEGFPAKKVKMLEILSLKWAAKKHLEVPLDKCWKDNNLKLIGSTIKQNNRSEIWGKIEGGDKIKQLLILKWGPWKESVKLLYIVGDFTLEDLKGKI